MTLSIEKPKILEIPGKEWKNPEVANVMDKKNLYEEITQDNRGVVIPSRGKSRRFVLEHRRPPENIIRKARVDLEELKSVIFHQEINLQGFILIHIDGISVEKPSSRIIQWIRSRLVFLKDQSRGGSR